MRKGLRAYSTVPCMQLFHKQLPHFYLSDASIIKLWVIVAIINEFLKAQLYNCPAKKSNCRCFVTIKYKVAWRQKRLLGLLKVLFLQIWTNDVSMKAHDVCDTFLAHKVPKPRPGGLRFIIKCRRKLNVKDTFESLVRGSGNVYVYW